MNVPERVLRRSGKKWLANLLVCVAFLAGGVATRGDSPVASWLMIVLFGCGAVVSGVALLPGSSSLRLTPDGFEQRILFRRDRVSWQHIDHFEGASGSVGVVYDADYASAASLRGVNRFTLGADGVLSDTFGMKADDLAALLNDWLRDYKDTSGT